MADKTVVVIGQGTSFYHGQWTETQRAGVPGLTTALLSLDYSRVVGGSAKAFSRVSE